MKALASQLLGILWPLEQPLAGCIRGRYSTLIPRDLCSVGDRHRHLPILLLTLVSTPTGLWHRVPGLSTGDSQLSDHGIFVQISCLKEDCPPTKYFLKITYPSVICACINSIDLSVYPLIVCVTHALTNVFLSPAFLMLSFSLPTSYTKVIHSHVY